MFIIGGGVNGAGIARDAAGRGYSVALAEMNDFASATSSSSTKLFHGGLRYLEFFKFRLVKEALIEREMLLRAMPHISWPMRFVLPVHPDMRFDSDTPTSRLLTLLMPWMKGRRPKWLIRLGLFLYDRLGGREILPATSTIDLRNQPEGDCLQRRYRFAYEYSDCWVEDARLTLLNVRDAQNKVAVIFPRWKVVSADQVDGHWHLTLEYYDGSRKEVTARMIVNTAGPWVGDVIQNTLRSNSTDGVRLVRGSHIITKRLFDHDKCYFFQGTDGRIMFAIPYEEDFTLIGTTDTDHEKLSEKPQCSQAEEDYMIEFVNAYLKTPITREDIVWRYSGVRPLYDDGASSATSATRDYLLKVDRSNGASTLNIFGGKITTYRKLAESALREIDNVLGRTTKPWTNTAARPGGRFDYTQVDTVRNRLSRRLPFLDEFTIRRLFRQYGEEAFDIFKGVLTAEDMGEELGPGVFSREIDWAMSNEWVYCADDFLWRRNNMGLRFTPSQSEQLDRYIQQSLTENQDLQLSDRMTDGRAEPARI